MLQAKLDEWGKPAWLSLLVLAFFAGWPLGLAVLAYLAGSGRFPILFAEAARRQGLKVACVGIRHEAPDERRLEAHQPSPERPEPRPGCG